MQKPEYELGPLRAGVVQANLNIASFLRAIDKEKDRIKEYEGHIEKWENYNTWLRNGDITRSNK